MRSCPDELLGGTCMRAMDGSNPWGPTPSRIRWSRSEEVGNATGGTRSALALMILLLVVVTAIVLASAGKARADTTVSLPSSLTVTADATAITLGDVSVLGPTTARITATIDPHVQGTIHVVYGTNGELNLSTPPIALPAATEAVKQVLDLVNLPAGELLGYRVVVDTPVGTAASVAGSFTT